MVLADGLAYGEYERHRLRENPARDKPQHPGRGIVEPLEIVHDAQQRPLLSHGRHQAERRQRDQEAVRRVTGHEPQGHPQGNLLRLRQPIQSVEHRRAQLVQSRVGQLHLRLDARDLGEPAAGGLLNDIAQQRRLADTRFATDDEHGTVPPAHILEQPVQQRALARSALEFRQTLASHW